MNIRKKTKSLLMLLVCLAPLPLSIFALSKMPSAYWFAGTMYIYSTDPKLSYSMYYWNDNAKRSDIFGPTIGVNKVVNIIDLYGGNIHDCPFMWWGGDPASGTKIMLIPNLSFSENPLASKEVNAQNRKQFEKDLRSGRKAPYAVIERQQNSINIFLLGKNVGSTVSLSQKLSFNFLAFESLWVAPSWWYNGLGNSAGMAFAFSFDNRGRFFQTSEGKLADNAFYIWGAQEWHDQSKWTLGYNWIGSQVNPKDTLTMQKLLDQGIVTYQEPFVSDDELQRIIDYVNSTGHANFENVISK